MAEMLFRSRIKGKHVEYYGPGPPFLLCVAQPLREDVTYATFALIG